MSRYLNQLSADLPRWVERGWVTLEGRAGILREVEDKQGRGWFSLPLVLSMLGGLLVFAGIISWVAANWDDVPRALRLVMILGVMIGALTAGHFARLKGSDGLGQGLAFLGVLMFGANLMLIGQMYHLEPNPAGGALLWMMGALLAAVLWPSQLLMALALALLGCWTGFSIESFERGRFHTAFIHWPFIPVWVGMSLYALKQNWTRALHISSLVLLGWLTYVGFAYFDRQMTFLYGPLLLMVLVALHLSAVLLKKLPEGVGVVSRYFWLALLLWLFIVSFSNSWLFGSTQYWSGGDYPQFYIALLLMLGLGGVAAYVKGWGRMLAVTAVFLSLHGVIPLLLYPSLDSASFVDYRAVIDSILLMAFSLALVGEGYRERAGFFINAGFTLFTVKLLWIYFDTVWGLEARVPFFILGGFLVIGLGIWVDRQRRRLLGKMKVEA